MSNYNETILIVEDDPQIRNFMKYAIEKEGFQLFSSSNAQNALNIMI